MANSHRRAWTVSFAASAAVLALAGSMPSLGWAQSSNAAAAGTAHFPQRPVRLVVSYPPGGTVDVVARIVATKLTLLWGQPVVVENRAGGGGIIGALQVVNAQPDGLTLLVDASNHSQNAALKKSMPFNTLKDLAPVSLLVKVPNMLVVYPGYEAKTVKDLIAVAKANPNQVNYASSGNGSAQHLTAELFAMKTQVKMTHVAYKGGGPAMMDVMSGQVPVFFASSASALTHIKSGKLLPVAMASGKRSPALPDVPTFAEAGLPGFETYEWNGVFAPAGTPPALVERISKDIATAVNDREIKARLIALGAEVIGSTPAQLDSFRKAEITRWTQVGKEANISLD